MLKCPYCHEVLNEKVLQCPHCRLYIIDEIFDIDFRSVEKKDCLFCGKKILKEARYCRYCQKWLDELNKTIEDIDWQDFA